MSDDAVRPVLLAPTLLIATAGAFIGVTERGSTSGDPMLDPFLASVRLQPGHPWCAAFVHYAGYWSHRDHVLQTSRWPLPNTSSCLELGEYASARGVLELHPAAGDVFLVFDAERGRFVHTGVVVKRLFTTRRADDTLEHDCVTIEATPSDDGRRDGNIIARRRRTLSPDSGDRFIRWVLLDTRAEDVGVWGARGNAAA